MPSPLSTPLHQIIYLRQRSFDSYKKSTALTKHFNFKKFHILRSILQNVLYCFTNLFCPKFFILTENFNTAFTPTEMKQNLLQIIFFITIFVSFEVIKHHSKRV